MSKQTGIQWTDSTHNFWYGCYKISQGCKNCYMYRDMARYGRDPKVITRAKGFDKPLSWKDPRKVFVNSWSDFFIKEADPWRQDAWDIIRRTPHLTYQILTKRPENIPDRLPDDWGDGWPNVWLGVSAEDQQYANERIPRLIEIPAKVRFLSCEPLLGEVDLTVILYQGDTQYYLNVLECRYTENPNGSYGTWFGFGLSSLGGINWVIIGGESGPNARPMSLDWARKIDFQCQQAGIPVFWKQLGAAQAREQGLKDPKGGDMDEWPQGIGRREFPESIPVEPEPKLAQMRLF